MIIGIDASRANRPFKSGTEWYSYYLIRHLAQIDSKNEYILYSDKPLEGGLADLSDIKKDIFQKEEPDFNEEGYQVLKSPFNNFKAKILTWPFPYFWTIGRLSLEMILHKPDVLFIPAHALPLCLPKKTVNTIHDVAFAREKELYRSNIIDYKAEEKKVGFISFLVSVITNNKYRAKFSDYLDWSTKKAILKAKKIITVSNFSKQEIMDIYKADPEKIEVIYNGYNNFLYNTNLDDEEKTKSILEDYGLEKPYLLYIGRLEKKKNIANLIEAFAILKENKKIDHKLVLIGNIGFGHDELKYIIEEFKLENDVIKLGWVQEYDLPILLKNSSAFVFPSKHEGFGIPVIQAMACGVPTVISDIPTLREIAQDCSVFFNPLDRNSIAESIDKVLSDKDLQQKLIEKGKARAQHFSWQKCAEQTLKILNNI